MAQKFDYIILSMEEPESTRVLWARPFEGGKKLELLAFSSGKWRSLVGSGGLSAYELALEHGFSGSIEEWLEAQKGSKGDTGNTGPQGPQGPQGEPGKSIVDISYSSETSISITYIMTFSDGSTFAFSIPKGAQGPKGDTGATGATGETGPKGDKGDKGDAGTNGTNGIDGKDAYQPFKGWFDSSSDLESVLSSPGVGDYAYVKGATASDPIAIYQCATAGTWTDSGHEFNPANNQEFLSGESLNTVRIIDDLTTGGAANVLSAKQGKELKSSIDALGPKISKITGETIEYNVNSDLPSIYQGKQIKASDANIGNTLAECTKYDASNFRNKRVDLTGADSIEFYLYASSSYYGCLFVDANDVIVGVKSRTSSQSGEIAMSIPTGAKYFIWSYNITQSDIYCRVHTRQTLTIPFEKVIDKNSGQTVGERITEVAYKDVATLHKAQVNALSPYMTDMQPKASGVVGTNISSVATTTTTGYNVYKIPILQNVTRITFPVYNSSLGYGSLITDVNGVVLQEFTNNIAAGGYTTGTLITVDVVTGAAYFYLSIRPTYYDATDFSFIQHVALKDLVESIGQQTGNKLSAIVNDAPKAANMIIDGNKVKLSADTIDDIAWENLSYRDIFETNNVLGITAGFESGSYSPLIVGAGSPTITTEDKDTGTYSLKAFGTSSCQLKNGRNIFGTYFIACRIKCSRYVKGYAGVALGGGTNGAYVTAVTNEFVTASGTASRAESSSAELYVGTWSSASIDCYIDTPVAVNTNIFAASPTAAELEAMYETYLARKFGNASVELLFVTEPADKEDEVCKNAFVTKMNEYATQFGMSNTYFANASGLTSESHTTAKDFVKLVACCTANEKVMRYWGRTSYSVAVGGANARTISGNSTYKGTSDSIAAIEGDYHIFGGKSGTYTPSSHTYQNLALCVKSKVDDRWICACIIDNSNSGSYGRFAPMKALLDWLEDKRQNPSASTPTIAASAAAAGLLPLGNPVSCADLDYTLVSKNGTTQYVPASMTKLMTAILVCEYAKMDEVLTIKASDIQSGSGDTYYEGDTISIGDAVLAMLLPSSNTLATALSRFVGNRILKIKSA